MIAKRFCCEQMEVSVVEMKVIMYSEQFDEYGIPIPEDDGVSYMGILYCPWCRRKLPPSKREKWFHELEKLGYDSPLFDDNIPEEFKSDGWYRK